MSYILQYDLLFNNFLLDDDFTSKRNKHMLVKNLEEKKEEPGENNVLVADFMSLISPIPAGQLSTFQDLLNTAWKILREFINSNRLI